MLSRGLEDAINEQIKHEFSSAYVYLSMSAYFERCSLSGFARWAFLQSQEEVLHAMKLFNYVNDRGGTVRLQAVGQPPSEFGSPLEVFQTALEQERAVTKSIHQLYDLAMKEHDYATQVMLEWFVSEQVEEEKAGVEIVDQLQMIGDNKTGMLLLDRELGARQPPAGGDA